MFFGVLPMANGQSTSVFKYESWLAKFVMNVLGFILFSHVVGSCWKCLWRSVLVFEAYLLWAGKLKKQVRESEQCNWSVSRGLNDLMLLENLPEDLQIQILRHQFNFLEKFPIFAAMDDYILDAIRERLQRKAYLKGSRILVCKRPVDKIVFTATGEHWRR
ncbi:hypothetical protein POM88_015965 [Heracleum sosnowskyi]|uniref:Cyclic nucleotide-binding domain-containing protein n=1 Tax=Heracleum sosnowskyi TaxID=360622 RepID=A0AAD8IL51_9APIA|nr:hypothetical protein POM88_015965 [Heracleum sosnowskyi]